AQIGKGMWAMPDKMAAMVEQKVGHVKAGANTAWVPSPTAGTLHAIHYHQIDFRKVQDEILKTSMDVNYEDDILEIPIESNPTWTKDETQAELANNAQTMLGSADRWLEQGFGTSKVTDIHAVGLMHDRA